MLFLIFIPNIITTAQFSFNDVKINGSEGYSLVWQGWKYYNEALRKDATFIPSIVSSYKKMLINIFMIKKETAPFLSNPLFSTKF